MKKKKKKNGSLVSKNVQDISLSSPFPKEAGKDARGNSLNREKCSPLSHNKLSGTESVLFSIRLI